MAFNINKFVKGSDEYTEHTLEQEITTQADSVIETPKKKRSKKNEIAPVVSAPPVAATSMSYVQENIPYAAAYQETNKQLDESITQLNILGSELMGELAMARSSKTLRNRYNIINEMTETATTILNSKIGAIKEKNSVIGQVHKLELDRMKQLKSVASEEDDNTKIANLYNAFVNTPVGVGPTMLGPSMQDVVTNNTGIPMMPIGNDQQAWEASLSPAENRMVLDAKGSIETVVFYDSDTGNRWFEVLDKNTQQPVPNVEKPDNSYIYDLDINVRGGFAKDSNRNTTYRLIVVNSGDTSINNY